MAYMNPYGNRSRTLRTYGLGVAAYASQLVTPPTYLPFQLAAILSRLPIRTLVSQTQATCNVQTCSGLYLKSSSNASKVRPNEAVLVILS